MQSQSLALIGYGAIAQTVLSAQRTDSGPHVAQVLVRAGKAKGVQAMLPTGCEAIETLSGLNENTGLVLECAGHEAVRTYAPEVLSRGIDFGILSIGALADDAVHAAVETAAREGDSQAIILPGAIGGIDALAAAAHALENVRYVSRKPPSSWRGSPAEDTHDLSAISKPTTLFQGNARRAALDYPKNANVVATVALAGIGFTRTNVKLLADPEAAGNTHEIIATGGGYAFHFKTTGAALPDNPRTSALTAQSALRALRGRGAGIVI